jgi:hypothetical protein
VTRLTSVLRSLTGLSGHWGDHTVPRAFEDYLLPAEAVRDTGIDGETDPARYVTGRAATLHERLNLVADRASRGELDGVEIECWTWSTSV